MSKHKLPIVVAIVMSLLSLPLQVNAQNLDSTNYRVIDATLDSGGGIAESTNYGLLESIGDFSQDPGLTSTNYKVQGGIQPAFEANVPEVACFETDTSGSSSCTTGPAYLSANGMIRVCGNPGCYNRARFEIDSNNNPTDTLYAVQVSTDNFVADIQYIDGISFALETSVSRTLSDYLTKATWETPTFNLQGLAPNTSYQVRFTALHGDFTESQAGPYASATTTAALISFDLDIASQVGVASESAAPYVVDLDTIYRGAPVTTSDDIIWIDADTNASGGIAIVQRGKFGGLYSAAATHLLTSATADLSSIAKGFGIQRYYNSQSFGLGGGQGELGILTAQTNYAGSGANVGIVPTVDTQLFYADAPLRNGRAGLYVRAKADNTVPVGTDYTEDVTFTTAGLY